MDPPYATLLPLIPSSSFLNDISRISARNYVPTTGIFFDSNNDLAFIYSCADDILHARIQTMGVAQHIFDVEIHGKPVTWHLYDVGGARGQRHTWVPYFDDANAIIFVSPISAFDQVWRYSSDSFFRPDRRPQLQYLEEDPRTNRIDDSLQLFTQICSNPLLKSVHLVLFLSRSCRCESTRSHAATVSQIRLISSEKNSSGVYGSPNSEFTALLPLQH